MAKPAMKATTDSPGEEGAPKGGAPLFPQVGTAWSYLDVSRLEPADEVGFLGRLDLSATEEQIKGRWGGGKFYVRAKNDKNQVCSNRTVDIAGDPIFVSETSRDRWLRGQGRAHEIPTRAPAAAPAPAAAAPAFGLGEIVALFQGMSAMQAQQQQAWMQAQAEQRRAEAEDRRALEQTRRDEDARREAARLEEERRREDRRAREDEASRQRDREFMKTTLDLVTNRPAGGEQGQMQAFLTGLTTAFKMSARTKADDDDDDGKDDDEDPIAETIRGTVRGIVDSIASRGQPPAAAAAAATTTTPAGPEPVVITGQLGEQLTTFVQTAKAKGQDPNKILAGAISVLTQKLDKPVNGAAASAAAAAMRAKEGTAPAAAG